MKWACRSSNEKYVDEIGYFSLEDPKTYYSLATIKKNIWNKGG